MTQSEASRARGEADRAFLKAIGLVCLGGLFFVVMNAMVKALTTEHSTVMLVWARYFFHVLVIVLIFPKSLIGVVRTPQVGIQVARSLLLLGATVTNFIALAFMPLGDVAAITFMSPILVAGLAIIMLRERVSMLRWAIIALGFAGAVLIVRPTGETVNVGALFALACAFSYALYQISTRMVREAEPIVSLLYGGLVGMVGFSVLVPFFWETPTLATWSWFVAIGAMGAIGHLFVIKALQAAEASKISPFTYIQLIWAMILGFFAFGDIPSIATMTGAVVIVTSGLLIWWLDRRERLTASPRALGDDRPGE